MDSGDFKEIYCDNCNNKLNDEFSLCPKCGSELKRITIHLFDSITMFDQIRVKSKVGTGKHKIQLDYIDGFETSNSDEIVYKRRVIDRLKNWYFEIVFSIKGKLIRYSNEKLTTHTGRGSAKKIIKHKKSR